MNALLKMRQVAPEGINSQLPVGATQQIECIINEPVEDVLRPGHWNHPLLYVATSAQRHGGMGVFAKRRLSKGWAFIVMGYPTDTPFGTHKYPYGRQTGGRSFAKHTPLYVDGDPTIKPHNNVGCYGLAIAMRVNEQSKPQPHNCVFKRNLLIVGRTIRQDEELFVYYGEGSDYVRTGYTMNGNPHKADDPDGCFHHIRMPTSKHLVEKWAAVIRKRIQQDKQEGERQECTQCMDTCECSA
jgi:hypothetical protein